LVVDKERQNIIVGKRVYNQIITGTVSGTTLRRLLDRRAEQLWESPIIKKPTSKP
jgi:hypothetical protein